MITNLSHITVLFFLFSFLTSCNTKYRVIQEAITEENHEIGMTYIVLMSEPIVDSVKTSILKSEEAFVIRAIPPKFKKVKVKYACSDLRKQLNKESNIKIQISPVHYRLFLIEEEWIKKNLKRYGGENAKGFIFIVVENEEEWQNISEVDLKGDSIQVVEKQLIRNGRLEKRYVKRRPLKLKKKELYFEAGFWGKPKAQQVNLNNGCGGYSYTIKDIKRQLKKLGYRVRVNHKLSKATKKALLDFQRKNGLEEGVLDFETLKALEIY